MEGDLSLIWAEAHQHCKNTYGSIYEANGFPLDSLNETKMETAPHFLILETWFWSDGKTCQIM